MNKKCYTLSVAELSVLDDLASSQLGYFTRAQAAAHRVDDSQLSRAVSRGRFVAAARGVYRVVGAPEHPHESLFAVWMGLDPVRATWQRTSHPDALVFGRSALMVWGIGDLPEIEHEFAVPRLRRLRTPGLVLRKRTWATEDWRPTEGMSVARPEWVITEGIRTGEELDHMAAVLSDARHAGLVDEGYLAACIARLGQSSARRARNIALATTHQTVSGTPSMPALRLRQALPLPSNRDLHFAARSPTRQSGRRPKIRHWTPPLAFDCSATNAYSTGSSLV